MAKKIIKVTAAQLQNIIAEEATRYKKVLELQRKKDAIMSQLNEMYEAEEIDEIFGFGKKSFNLNALKPSAEAIAFATKHPARKVAIDAFKKHYNMNDDLAMKAVQAVYDFAGGVPMLAKYSFDFNPQTMTLTIDPNKGGLFSGHPIMGEGLNEEAEEIDEIFGFGKKSFNLNALKPSADAIAFTTRHPARKVGIDAFKKHYNMNDDLAMKAVQAVYDFAGGVPQLSKYSFNFEPQTMTLTIDPNKGGLFSGHPIMG